MSRLPRPYIPLAVRVEVAERQMKEATGCVSTNSFGVPLNVAGGPLRARLDAALFHLSRGGAAKLELHHRPALVNRRKIKKLGVIVRYTPDANDPRHLFYLPDDDHDIETRVRGLRGQHSDLAMARKNKNIAENRAKKQRGKQVASGLRTRHLGPRKSDSKPWGTAKRIWPKQSFPKGRGFGGKRREP